MFEENAVHAAYNYMMALGPDYISGVQPEHVFTSGVSGHVHGHLVEIFGYRRKGASGFVGSYCLHAAMVMEMWMNSRYCRGDGNGIWLLGGAWKAHGNGDLWVTTL
jgi:hypothetical protein